MLVVFQAAPIAAPNETMTFEKAVEQVVLRNFVAESPGAVGVRAPFLGVDAQGAVFTALDERVVERIDVDGTSPAVV